MFNGPSVRRRLLLAAVLGKNIPEKGKHAKINPVPIKPMKDECREPVGEFLPFYRFIIVEKTRAKKPAKT
jgi:hypothetical protein